MPSPSAPPSLPLPLPAPALDPVEAAKRIRVAEQPPTSGSRRADLVAQLALLNADITERRAALTADETLFTRLLLELRALESDDQAMARAVAPTPGLYATLGEACGMARCNEATMRKKLRAYPGLGWKVDGRWKISRPELIAHLAALDG